MVENKWKIHYNDVSHFSFITEEKSVSIGLKYRKRK